jgi:hypothetical protein
MANKQYNLIAAATTNANLIQATPARITTVQVYNAAGTFRVVKLYNKITAPVPASDQALIMAAIQIPAGQSKEINYTIDGIQFTLGLGIAITGAAPLNDATAIAASDVTVTIIYNDLA